ncbi:ATP-binding protein [Streptomyces roseifaciens]
MEAAMRQGQVSVIDSPGWEELGNRVFSGLPQSVGEARRFLTGLCTEVGLDDELPVLLLSEVATNAVRHAGGRFRVRCFCSPQRRLRVEVEDGSNRTPVRRGAGVDDESGRGVSLLDLGSCWRTEVNGDGKTVIFVPKEKLWA